MLPRKRIVQWVGKPVHRRLEHAVALVRFLRVRAFLPGIGFGAEWGHAAALPTTGASPADLATAPASPHCSSQLASIR